MNRHVMRQFGQFVIVGIANTLLTFAIYALLLHLHVFYVLAWTIAFLAGTVQSYLVNRYWTFSLPGFSMQTLARYLIVQVFVLGVSSGLLVLAVEDAGANKLVAEAVLLPAITLMNFTLIRVWALAPARRVA